MAVGALDGTRVSLLTIEADPPARLAVGGGPDRFIVYCTHDNDTFFSRAVTKDIAIEAARYFLEHEAPAPTVSWMT